jgi:hypothetical protein
MIYQISSSLPPVGTKDAQTLQVSEIRSYVNPSHLKERFYA